MIKIAHLGKDFRITWYLRYQDIVPFDGLATHANQLVDVRDLVDHLVAVRDDSMQLLERLERFVVVAETLVDEAQVVDCLDAVSFNTDGFKEELFGSVVLFTDEEAVAFVNKSLGVVPIMLDC